MIALQQICRSFQVGDETVHALDDVTLQIEQGDYISVMGPSGSGKSTLLNLLGLLDKADSGSYRFEGTELTTLTEEQRARFRREKVGFIFQSFHLVPRLTAAGNIALPLTLAGIPPATRNSRVLQALESLDMVDRAEHRPAQLSGGQQQRVAIARAMIMHPPLLLADEPTGNLDSHSGQEVIETLEQLNADGVTLIVVTHDMQLGKRAGRRITMVDGRVTADR
ncbi:MAG: ABC transporter ATP-binding protein [Pseudomonadota bacterium]